MDLLAPAVKNKAESFLKVKGENQMLNKLVEMSRKYGKNPEYVLAGGGNTSCKDKDFLYIKGSGTSLATIEAEQFVKMDRSKLNLMWDKKYSDNEAEREAQVLSDMMASKAPGNESKRPSVETLLHDIFKQTFVLHVHPALVNGITCAVKGKEAVEKLFPEAIWVEATKPGYILADLCNRKMNEYRNKYNKEPDILFLQNHGIFVAADDIAEIDRLADFVMTSIKNEVRRVPDQVEKSACKKKVAEIKSELGKIYEGVCVFANNADIEKFAESSDSMKPLIKSFTPDHIVYCKAFPLYVENSDNLKADYEAYEKVNGFKAKIIFVKGVGMFAVGANEKEATIAKTVFFDAMKIAVYTESFGGAYPMTDELIDFIVNWEVESYRSKTSLGK